MGAAAVTVVLLLVIAINTTTTAGDASSAERTIESYAKTGMWMLAIIGVTFAIYVGISTRD